MHFVGLRAVSWLPLKTLHSDAPPQHQNVIQKTLFRPQHVCALYNDLKENPKWEVVRTLQLEQRTDSLGLFTSTSQKFFLKTLIKQTICFSAFCMTDTCSSDTSSPSQSSLLGVCNSTVHAEYNLRLLILFSIPQSLLLPRC